MCCSAEDEISGNLERVAFEIALRNYEVLRDGEAGARTLTPFLSGLSASGARIAFVLDGDYLIENCSCEVVSAFGRPTLAFRKRPFTDFIAAESLVLWREVAARLETKSGFCNYFVLTFKSVSQVLLPAICHVHKLADSGRALVYGIMVFKDVYDPVDQAGPPAKRSPVDNLYRFILENLEQELPSTQELARMFCTNDFALKSEFRKVFGTSIYQFYLSEKLKRTHLFIEQSTIPLYKLATDMGFGSYGNFSKAFRKKYGYAPSQVKRWDEASSDDNG